MTAKRKRTKVKKALKEAETSTKRKLSREILMLFLLSALIAVTAGFFLRSMAGTLIWNYCERNEIVLTEMQQMDMDFLIGSGSFLATVLLFILLFFILFGRKLAYLQAILDGVEALRIHRMDYVIPVKGNNEFTELAKSINYLSETERMLNEKEKRLKIEREQLIRALSHDIRTPLTSIKSYSEMMAEQIEREGVQPEEVKAYVNLMMKKADQMKELTSQLLENSKHRPEWIENGKLLMEQLVLEWEEQLEEQFVCRTDTSRCPDFSAEIDIREFQRIFDNLYSNVEKYANPDEPVELIIEQDEKSLLLCQKNGKKKNISKVESHQIGLLSIRAIAGNYGGDVQIKEDEEHFEIWISLVIKNRRNLSDMVR